MMTVEDCRRFYAQEVRFAANISSPELVEAYASVPRESTWVLRRGNLARPNSGPCP
jgi:hypothetical protein